MQITGKNIRVESYGNSQVFYFHIEKDGSLITTEGQDGPVAKEFAIQIENGMDVQAECAAFIQRVKARIEAEESAQPQTLIDDLTV